MPWCGLWLQKRSYSSPTLRLSKTSSVLVRQCQQHRLDPLTRSAITTPGWWAALLRLALWVPRTTSMGTDLRTSIPQGSPVAGHTRMLRRAATPLPRRHRHIRVAPATADKQHRQRHRESCCWHKPSTWRHSTERASQVLPPSLPGPSNGSMSFWVWAPIDRRFDWCRNRTSALALS
jgi:hypothetical protein